MRKTNLIFARLLVLLTFIFNNEPLLFSQTYVNPGAEWVFWGAISGGPAFYRRWRYEEDITIDTLTYQKISVLQKNYWNDGGPIVTINHAPFLFRSSGDSLLKSEIDGSNERLLYDFTPVIGNSWDVTSLVSWWTVEPTSPLLIQTIAFGDTIINGVSVNWIEVESSNPDTLIFSGRIHNHFGKEQTFPFWNDGTLDTQPSVWKCYRDDLLGEIGYSPCVDVETIGIIDLEEINVSIKPKYFEKKIEITLKNKNELEMISISNIAGKIITVSTNLNFNSIEFDEPSGIYFITLKFRDLPYTEKFFWSNN
jgi:hypothetical protein